MSDRGGDADDDVTIWAGRLRAWPTPPDGGESVAPTDLDDETVLARRRAAEERTLLSRRAADAAAPEHAVADDDLPDEATMPGRRGVPKPADGPDEDDEPDEDTAPGSRASGAPETRSRRSAARAAEGLPEERRARVPSPDDREIYRPRAVAPVIAVRAAPEQRAPQAPVDVAAASAALARTRRRRALAIVLITAVVVAVAVAAVVWAAVAPA